jgi:hypothetical protein
MADALEVEAKVVGDHEELVGGRELDVPPGVGVELGQLRLLREELDDLRGEQPEEGASALQGPWVATGDDLGQRAQLAQRVALGDALRAEDDVDRLAELLHPLGDHRGHARVDGAPEHQKLPVHQVIDLGLDRLQHRSDLGVEEAVDWRADDDHHRLGGADRPSVGGGGELAARQNARQQLVGPLFAEGHAPRVDPDVAVVQHHGLPPVGKGDPERQPHMPTAADDGDVPLEHGQPPIPPGGLVRGGSIPARSTRVPRSGQTNRKSDGASTGAVPLTQADSDW